MIKSGKSFCTLQGWGKQIDFYNNFKNHGFEGFFDIVEAIAREKQIKAGSRKKKIDLINSMNPEWKDLYDEYFENS
jgi:predicted GIY-YIG superfamily endonuclease